MNQIPIALPITPSYAHADFIVSDCNRLAYDMLQRWPDWPSPFLWLYGTQSSGKTHLAHIWSDKSRACFIRPDQLQDQSTDTFGQHQALILDEPIEGYSSTHLFHLLNYAQQQPQHYILFTQRSPASRLNITPPDLASRLNAVPALTIEAPDDCLLEGLMMKLLADRQMALSPQLIHYTIQRIDRSCGAISQFVQQLDEWSLKEKRPITKPFIKEIVDLHTNTGQI